ncbi:hypothetical protein C8R44DRAFT_951019 [Mycena epipterygia]|nr:hypothetical protein C8R44DRAFT_951019 [Mycena epipterygia]
MYTQRSAAFTQARDSIPTAKTSPETLFTARVGNETSMADPEGDFLTEYSRFLTPMNARIYQYIGSTAFRSCTSGNTTVITMLMRRAQGDFFLNEFGRKKIRVTGEIVEDSAKAGPDYLSRSQRRDIHRSPDCSIAHQNVFRHHRRSNPNHHHPAPRASDQEDLTAVALVQASVLALEKIAENQGSGAQELVRISTPATVLAHPRIRADALRVSDSTASSSIVVVFLRVDFVFGPAQDVHYPAAYADTIIASWPPARTRKVPINSPQSGVSAILIMPMPFMNNAKKSKRTKGKGPANIRSNSPLIAAPGEAQLASAPRSPDARRTR